MDFITDDEYRQMEINSQSSKIEDLENKIDIMAIQIHKIQQQLSKMIEYK